MLRELARWKRALRRIRSAGILACGFREYPCSRRLLLRSMDAARTRTLEACATSLLPIALHCGGDMRGFFEENWG